MKLGNITIVFLLAVAVTTPVSANWFDATQYGENHKKLLGSAPTPTPDDLRAVGDSPRGAGKTYSYDDRTGHWHEVLPSPNEKKADLVPGSPIPAPPANAAKDVPGLPARP